MQQRILQLDYLKGVFILLMVIFHLQLINKTYPVLSEAVYTFHMSAFLIISGYLANIEKDIKTFGKGILRLLVPYVIFESIYILMIYFLGKIVGASNQIENLDVYEFIHMIIFQPFGTYWYIHTLIICTTIYYSIYKGCKLNEFTCLVLTAMILYGLTNVIDNLRWENVIYFLIGICIQRSRKSFIDVISPSFVVILPLIVLFSSRGNYYRGSMAGIAITVFVVSFLLFLYNYSPTVHKRLMLYFGKTRCQ